MGKRRGGNGVSWVYGDILSDFRFWRVLRLLVHYIFSNIGRVAKFGVILISSCKLSNGLVADS